MCEIIKKVPNKKQRLGENSRGGVVDQDNQWLLMYQPLMIDEGSSSSSMLSEVSREREMSAMVSALTHVVAGDVPDHELPGNENLDGFGSSTIGDNNITSSCGFGGQKRGREEEEGGGGGGGEGRMAVESVTKLCTPFGNFPHGGGGSSSAGVRGKQLG